MAGTKILYGNRRRLAATAAKLLLQVATGDMVNRQVNVGETDGVLVAGGSVSGIRPQICYKAPTEGNPVTDAAEDEPDGLGQICIDTQNDDVYICTEHDASTTHTWVKITV